MNCEIFMKIQLWHTNLGRYVNSSGGWANAPSEGKEFSLVSDAVNFCNEHNLKEIELVITVGDPPSESRVPIERALFSVGDNGIFH